MKPFKLIDLTHSINPDIPTFTGSCGFYSEVKMTHAQGCLVQKFSMHAGIGTHIDAPYHFFEKGLDIASLPLEGFMQPLHVVDVSNKCTENLCIDKQDILAYESTYGSIQKKSVVAIYTGWYRHWPNASYRNPDAQGHCHYPKVSKQAAEYLIEKDISAIGVDTLNPDGDDTAYPVHHVILGSGKYIIENLNNLHLMPPTGGQIIAFPAKICCAAEVTVRAVGMIYT